MMTVFFSENIVNDMLSYNNSDPVRSLKINHEFLKFTFQLFFKFLLRFFISLKCRR